MKNAKRLQNLRAWQNNVRPEEFQTVLLSFDFKLRDTSGSHWVYSHPKLPLPLSIPHHRPLKPVYVRLALKAIEAVTKEESP